MNGLVISDTFNMIDKVVIGNHITIVCTGIREDVNVIMIALWRVYGWWEWKDINEGYRWY